MRFSGKCFLNNNENKGIPSQKNFPFTEELYKKYLNDPDNHDSMIIHLEPDILEWKVKWALGSITTNKASGGDGIQLSYFKS